MPHSISSSFNPMSIGSIVNEHSEPNTTECGKSHTDGLIYYDDNSSPHTVSRNQAYKYELDSPQIARTQTGPFLRTTTPSLTPSLSYDSLPSFSGWQPQQSSRSPSSHKQQSSTRAPRPKYEPHQAFFIWYHRTDLNEGWDQVIREFRAQFHQDRPKGGLQCKFYRLLDAYNVEKVRTQTKSVRAQDKDLVGRYGVVQRTNKRFEWMREEHKHASPLPQFSGCDSSPSSVSLCQGCSQCDHE